MSRPLKILLAVLLVVAAGCGYQGKGQCTPGATKRAHGHTEFCHADRKWHLDR